MTQKRQWNAYAVPFGRYFVSWSHQALERMMATPVDVFGAFGFTLCEETTESMGLPIPHAPATPIAFTTTGQRYW